MSVPDANVNVIFHGLFLFVPQKGFMDVIIPNMGMDHVYRAGTFLIEESMAPAPVGAPYFLNGVTGGDDGFDHKKNIVFDDQDFNHSASQDDVFARIVLPVPIEIVSLRPTRQALQADFDSAGVVNGKKPCGLQILRYNADHLDRVTFTAHDGNLGLNAGNHFLNLHIIAEPDCPCVHDTNHARTGFQRALQLLPGVTDPIFIKNFTTLDLHRDNDTDRGFAAIETLDLRERATMVTKAGLDWRDDKPHKGVVDDVLVEAVPQDCLPIIGDNES
jgi:hypothetical protein